MFSDVWICGILCSLLLPKVGVPGSLSNIRRAQSTLPIRWPCGRGPCCCCCCSTQKTKNSHTLDYLLDSFSQLSQFWFSDIRITNGGMCLMRKALLIKLGQKWFEPNLTRSGSLIDVKDNDNDDATCSSVGRSRCFACLLGGRWKNQQFARSNNHRKWLRHACRGIPIWIIDKFLHPLKWVQDLDYNSELGSCLGSLNGRSRRSTTNKSIGEPPGWDCRGSKMAAFKYLICRYPIG